MHPKFQSKKLPKKVNQVFSVAIIEQFSLIKFPSGKFSFLFRRLRLIIRLLRIMFRQLLDPCSDSTTRDHTAQIYVQTTSNLWPHLHGSCPDNFQTNVQTPPTRDQTAKTYVQTTNLKRMAPPTWLISRQILQTRDQTSQALFQTTGRPISRIPRIIVFLGIVGI